MKLWLRTTIIWPYTVRNSVDCKSSNVVYAVFCERCRAYVYIGETGDTLYQRHLLNLSRSAHGTLTRWRRTFTQAGTAWRNSAWCGWRSCMAPTTTGGRWSSYGSGSSEHTGPMASTRRSEAMYGNGANTTLTALC